MKYGQESKNINLAVLNWDVARQYIIVYLLANKGHYEQN